jgi:hypothetical protein
MQKFTIKLDVTKLNKDKFRTYEKKDGTKVIEASVDVVVMDESKHKVITKADGTPIQGDGWRLEKVGFLVETQSKEEKSNGVKDNFVGDVTEFKNTDSQTKVDKSDGVDEINSEDIPF